MNTVQIYAVKMVRVSSIKQNYCKQSHCFFVHDSILPNAIRADINLWYTLFGSLVLSLQFLHL